MGYEGIVQTTGWNQGQGFPDAVHVFLGNCCFGGFNFLGRRNLDYQGCFSLEHKSGQSS